MCQHAVCDMAYSRRFESWLPNNMEIKLEFIGKKTGRAEVHNSTDRWTSWESRKAKIPSVIKTQAPAGLA